MRTLLGKRSIVKRLDKQISAKDGGSGAKSGKHLLQIFALPERWVLPPNVVCLGKHRIVGTSVE